MAHATATVNGVIIAETDTYEQVEGNVYFPRESIKWEYFKPTDTTTACPWKGTASYYTIDVGDDTPLPDAAWLYPNPKPAANNIQNHVAFYTDKVSVQV